MALRGWGHLFIQPTIPNAAPVMVGSLWLDTSSSVLKQCTSISPYTFSDVGGGGGGGGAPVGAQYLVLSADGTLTNERVLTPSGSLTYVDNGAGGSYELKLVNDATSPGNNKYYGTDAGGAKGFHTLTGGSGSGNSYFPAGWS